MKIHQIKIDFNVTPDIARYVFVYLIEGKNIYMIDSGVAGSEVLIEEYLMFIGKNVSDIKSIFLTHAHPDHIGTAAYFKQKTGCKIYASDGERPWIENINKQFRERPIPNFYSLAGQSTQIDCIVKNGDSITLEDGITINVMETSGHSVDELSYIVDSYAFIGDTIPVKGDIPIYINPKQARESIKKIALFDNITTFYPAWDKAYTSQELQQKASEALDVISAIDNAVVKALNEDINGDFIGQVCSILGNKHLQANPLFATTVKSHIPN